MRKLRIALDIDDTIGGFIDAYNRYYKTDISKEKDSKITRQVNKLRYNKSFWESLSKIEDIDFIPEMYCTKRVNPKDYTKNWLRENNFPVKPVYQVVYQKGNKARFIKGRCDVLIDDSVSNVLDCINAGLPALLIDRPHNRWFGPEYRIYSLSYTEIEEAYNILTTYV